MPPERDESFRPALRPVDPHRQQQEHDAIARLRAALAVLDSKLHGAHGVDGIADWFRRAERIVQVTSDEELERTRKDIRELIEKLLELNAQVQNIARLKHLLG
jgi:hypothetical protein